MNALVIESRRLGAKKLFPGHRASNRAYLHDVWHHGPQLSEGPTQNRRDGDANRVFHHSDHASLARAVRAFGRETNFVPKRIPNLLPSGFQGVYLASWGALIRPASHNRHTRPKGQRGVSTTILNMYYTSSEGSAVLLWEHNRNLGGSHRSHSRIIEPHFLKF